MIKSLCDHPRWQEAKVASFYFEFGRKGAVGACMLGALLKFDVSRPEEVCKEIAQTHSDTKGRKYHW